MNPRRITLSDLAHKAGVHVTTVSLCLRNHPRIPLPTRKRIQKLARKMGYTPDPNLQALIYYRSRTMARKSPPTLAYLTNWSRRSGWQNMVALPQYYSGAFAGASESGFTLKHVWMQKPGFTLARLNRDLCNRRIAGLIVGSHTAEVDQPLELDWGKFPAVKIDCFPHQPVLHKVTNNQRGAIRLAMQRVSTAGYRRIGLVMHRGWDQNADYSWMSGLLWGQALLDRADAVPLLYFPEVNAPNKEVTGQDSGGTASPTAFKRWYERYRPDVILSKWSFVQACFAEMEIRIPFDVAFVDLFLENTRLGIAGVRQNYSEVGRVAVKVVADQINHNKYGVPPVAKTTVIEGTWADGASCPTETAPRLISQTDSENIFELQVRA